MNQRRLPEISIVIPTFNRPDCLVRLLDSLRSQTASKEEYEIIVVDNAPEERGNEVKKLCDVRAYSALDLHYISHPTVGVSSARNRGVEVARSELIGFLDDDSFPHPDWVETVLRLFSDTNADILGGPTQPYYLVAKPKWFRDRYLVSSQGEKACWLVGNKAVTGANMAWRKKIIVDLGGFSSDYGYVGTKKVFGDETELNQRARQAGYTTWYDPGLMIEHCAHPHRMRVSWFFSSGIRYGQIKARLNFEEWLSRDTRPITRQILSQFKTLGINFFKVIGSFLALPFRSNEKYPHWQNYAVEVIRPGIERFSLALKLLDLTISGGTKS